MVNPVGWPEKNKNNDKVERKTGPNTWVDSDGDPVTVKNGKVTDSKGDVFVNPKQKAKSAQKSAFLAQAFKSKGK